MTTKNDDPHPIGKWVRSMGNRYWEGGCTCGSGEEGYELYDKMGIYAGISCKVCQKEKTFAPGIMPGDEYEYDVDEPIEEDK